MSDAKHLVFVYGTLKTGERNFAKYMSKAISLGPARTMEPGFLMSHHQSITSAGKYSPDAVRVIEGGGRIVGEVFEVDDIQLSRLDELEGIAYPDEAGISSDEKYYREQITLEDGRIAWAYLSREEKGSVAIPHIVYDNAENSFYWKEIQGPFPS